MREVETSLSKMQVKVPITWLASIWQPPSISFSNAGERLAYMPRSYSLTDWTSTMTMVFTLGANFRFNRQGDGFWTKALNGLNLMGEYYDGVVNVGGNYAVWKDRINLTASLYDGKYWSVGLYFRVCLK